MKDIVSIRDLCREDIENLIQLAQQRKQDHTIEQNNQGKVASLFFENSTRTRVSSEAAAMNLGYQIFGFSGAEGTSVKKGEPLLDTVRMFSGYQAKAVFIRHNLAGAARFVADNIPVPIINCGDGSNMHPTQTLLDLFTIYEQFKRIDGLHIAFVGDLKYGRTVHSLMQALEMFNVHLTLISPPTLQMAKWRMIDYEQKSGRKIHTHTNLNEVIPTLDVLYVTRIQRERFPEGPEGDIEFNVVSGKYVINAGMLNNAKPSLKILHPLPRDRRNIEIHPDVDKTKYALYFTQAENGMYMREAILSSLLQGKLKGNNHEVRELPEVFENIPVKNGQKIGEKLVYRLDSGVLIDHIRAGKAHKVYQILGLDQLTDHEVVICNNIRSKKLERKDVLAIHGIELTPEQLYRVALIDPGHTINFIKDKRVYKKGRAILPSVIENHIICSNKLCISRDEHKEFVPSKFTLENSQPLTLRCHYCEKITTGDTIEFKL